MTEGLIEAILHSMPSENGALDVTNLRLLSELQQDARISQAELGRRCAMDRSDVVAAINELAEQDCVERTPDPDDRRRNRVTLTTAGREQLQRIDRVLDRVQDDFLEPLSAEDRRALTELLTRLLRHQQRA